MPEYAEVRIMSDFINQRAANTKFKSLYSVDKANSQTKLINQDFNLSSDTIGKQMILNLNGIDNMTIYVFMSLMGNWSSTKTNDWTKISFCRLRFDDINGESLILHGGYMGPKFSVNSPFSGTKRGPDPLKQPSEFESNIFDNLSKKNFQKPIPEVLLNQRFFNGVGAYLVAEILGRLDLDPFTIFSELNREDVLRIINTVKECCKQSYIYGGGELMNWKNPMKESNIQDWLQYYQNKEICQKQIFGKRNIWIHKKWIS